MTTLSLSSISLDAWTKQGSTLQSAETYKRVQDALGAYPWPQGYAHDLHLQGSYKNSTNIRGDSDVDIVAVMTGSFGHGTENLSDYEKARFSSDFSDSQQSLSTFKEHVVKALVAKFGAKVTLGKKCINVGGEGERLNADVLACQSYRKYRSYQTLGSTDYASGIRFWVGSESRWVINFPKQHYQNGVAKQDRCNQNYKPMVRLVKHARNHLIDKSILEDGITPSYFVECWLSNVTDAAFRYGTADSFAAIVTTLVTDFKDGRMEFYKCQNGETLLFGPTPEQWRIEHATATLSALLNFWK